MPVKIRLARRGRKFSKIYTIAVADSRAPRDGRYIETLGQYNPNSNPASIELDFDKSLEWLQKGAQPTDTCRAILSYKGVMYKKHLLEGVKKGAFDEAEAEKRFQAWQKDKEAKIQVKIDKLSSEKDSAKNERFVAETKVKEERALAIEKERSKLLEKQDAEKDEEAVSDESSEDGIVSDAADVTPAEEQVAEDVKEEPVADEKAMEEPVADEKATEEPVAEEKAAEETTDVEKAVEENVADKAAEEPVAEEKAAEEPVAEKKAAEEPAEEIEAPADEKTEEESEVEEKAATDEKAAEIPASEDDAKEDTEKK